MAVSIRELDQHPLSAAFPALGASELRELTADIEAHGQLVPIVLYEKRVLDGWHRYQACRKLGIEPMTVTFRGSVSDAFARALGLNARRRHLSKSQLATIVAGNTALIEQLEAEAAARQRQSLKRGVKKPRVRKSTHTGPRKPKRVSAQLAETVGVSASLVEHAKRVLEDGTDAEREAVRSGMQTVTSAAKAIVERLAQKIDKGTCITLPAWAKLSVAERLAATGVSPSTATFNNQKNANIEWAQFSWNPITGCKHDCPYCYARDIAQELYPQKFVPALYPARLAAARNTKVPRIAANDVAYRNVFTCSMADLFGRWVPAEWIQAVLDVVRDNPQWNFLFLTKFPKRYREFEPYPDNAWLGTTVDTQARVAAAEEAFDGLQCGVRWLSIEPMLSPLRFTRLECFQWIVLGGASRSVKTPEWRVPADWWAPLHAEAKALGLRVYHKTNLLVRSREFPGQDAGQDPVVPAAFDYLGTKTRTEIVRGEE